MKITAEHVESLGLYLSPRYDQVAATPEFHRECWALYCSDAPNVAVAAPRKHAKSTALTQVFGLACVLFRAEDYVIIFSSTEELAIEQLDNIAVELRENEDLIRDFGIKGLITDMKTDIIVECNDGHQFRILAKGSEQKIRGRRWRGKRPGLLLGDDLEDDEQVESKERRGKFRRWFFRAARPVLRKGGRVRVHGTILHEDSLLANLMKDKMWQHLFYKAHTSFDNFSNRLWPEQFSESDLRTERQIFINRMDPAGYSQEYLNDPFDSEDAYLRRDDFLPMSDEDIDSDKVVCAAADFAVSTDDRANRSSLTVGGKDVSNILHFIDQRVGRWDYLELVEEMFSVQAAWHPTVFFVEAGVIWKTLEPTLIKEMQRRNVWIAFEPMPSTKDKAVRGRAFQKRMRAHGCRFNKNASWYPDFEAELLRFTEGSEAILDDQFDSASLLCRGFESLAEVEAEDFYSQEDIEFEAQSMRLRAGGDGRSIVTGY
jgi:predicted phage terminase large subunit-like protein